MFLVSHQIGLDKSLKLIKNDDDIKEIIKYALDVNEIELFYEHHHETIPLQVVELPSNEDDKGRLGKINIDKEVQAELV